MKAMIRRTYGRPGSVVVLEELDPPDIADDQVLIRVRAASVNPYDWHMTTGKPYLARLQAGLSTPKNPVLGSDVAGVVEAVGAAVDDLRPGDEIFGECPGSYAEYARASRKYVVTKPDGVSFEEAAAVPMAALTALQGLRDHGRIEAGRRVLINGASGGVGTFAVQLAKWFGAEVTGVCSTRNVDMVRSIGADHVVDYTREDFTEKSSRYDLILDVVGNHPVRAVRRVLEPEGVYVVAGWEEKGDWIQPITSLLKVIVASQTGSQTMKGYLARPGRDDLLVLRELLASKDLEPVIDRTYSLSEVPEALEQQGAGHARGKTVITI